MSDHRVPLNANSLIGDFDMSVHISYGRTDYRSYWTHHLEFSTLGPLDLFPLLPSRSLRRYLPTRDSGVPDGILETPQLGVHLQSPFHLILLPFHILHYGPMPMTAMFYRTSPFKFHHRWWRLLDRSASLGCSSSRTYSYIATEDR